MVPEYFLFVENYLFLVLSGLIGYILWHKFYNGNNHKKLRNHINYQLQWINLSLFVLILLTTTLFLIKSFFLIFDNTYEDVFGLFRSLLDDTVSILVFLFILFSVSMINITREDTDIRKFSYDMFYVIYFLFFIDILGLIFFLFYNPVISPLTYFIASTYLFLLLYAIIFSGFKFKFKKNEKRKFIKISFLYGIVLIFFTILFSFLANNIEYENSYTKEIFCKNTYDCYEEYHENYSINHGPYSYYKFDFIGNSSYLLEIANFNNNTNSRIVYFNSPFDKDMERKNIKIISLKKDSNEFAFNLNPSLRKSISNIDLQFEREITYHIEKPFLINLKYLNQSTLNFNFTKNTSNRLRFGYMEFDSHILNDYQNCSFVELNKDNLKCSNKECNYRNNNDRFEFYFENESNSIHLTGEIEQTKNIVLDLPISCSNKK